MLSLTLTLKRINDHELVLRLPLGFRVIFGVIVVILLSSMIASGSTAPGPVVLLILSILSGLYKEEWRFQKDRRIVEHRSGLLFPYVTKRFSFEEIDHFALSLNTRASQTAKPPKKETMKSLLGGRRQPSSMGSFGLVKPDGKAHTIEIRKSKSIDEFSKNAQEIADFCEISLKLQE